MNNKNNNDMRRVYFLIILFSIVIQGCVGSENSTSEMTNYPFARKYQVNPHFIELPVGAVKPEGWLLDWAKAARNGIGGIKSQYYKNAWLNGRPKDFLAESGGYVIDGQIKLAIILDDKELLETCINDIKEVIRNRYYADIPEGNNIENWSTYCYFRGMMTYYLHTGDDSAKTAMEDALLNELEIYHTDTSWHQRARPLLLSQIMLELYQCGGDSSFLSKALETIDISGNKSGWAKQFHDHWHSDEHKPMWVRPFKNDTGSAMNSMHAVTYNEMAKLWAIHYLWNGEKEYLEISENAYDQLRKNETQPDGGCTAQENVLGTGSFVGTETCNYIDMSYSLHKLLSITGKGEYADWAERTFYNGGASSVNRTFDKHVYFQSPNRLEAKDRFQYKWVNSISCCHSNLSRLLPTFISNMWMATYDKGAAIMHYAPNKAVVKVADNQEAAFRVNSNYPFEEEISISIELKDDRQFPIYFRIPGWCNKAEVLINSKNIELKEVKQGFVCIDRTWSDNDLIEISLPMKIEIHEDKTKSNGGIASVDSHGKPLKAGLPYSYVTRGPITFALPLEKSSDYEYSLLFNTNIEYQAINNKMPDYWDWPLDAPVKIVAKGVPFNWDEFPEMPDSKISSDNEAEDLVLVPIGCTKAKRISMFPVNKNSN